MLSVNNVIQTTATKGQNSTVTENVQNIHPKLQNKPSVTLKTSKSKI